MGLVIVGLVLIMAVAIVLFMKQPQFGKAPESRRLERMQSSPNFREGVFHNQSHTPSLTEGYSFVSIFFKFLFQRIPDSAPVVDIPTVKNDLHRLPDDVLVWFGHSSYFIKKGGLKILVDPVFSGSASPVPGFTEAFRGTDAYDVADLPEIDYLIISHDHYDHLDYKTVKQLINKVGKVVCGLGVGAHLEHWGFASEDIIEKDWNEMVMLSPDVKLYTYPARHFSGRAFKRNNTLWLSFLLETADQKIYLGGDSGYDRHFKEVGEQHGPIDFALLENGQYNEAWRAIHCLPHETLQAGKDLQAHRIMPIHSAKFALGMHPWYHPLEEITKANSNFHLPLVTPRIGEVVYLKDESQEFQFWWKDFVKPN